MYIENIIDDRINRLKIIKKDLEFELSELLILNKALVDTDSFFKDINDEIYLLENLKENKARI